MQALLLHDDRRPPLGRGTVLLPIRSWGTGMASLRVLRATARHLDGHPIQFLTMVHIPDDHPVAVVAGRDLDHLDKVRFHPLSQLPPEDRELLQRGLANESNVPDLSSDSSAWVVRLVIGLPLSRHDIKWTKDLRLFDDLRANSSIKRR